MATLVVHDREGPGQRLVLSPERPAVIGRDSSCDIVLSHASVSRRHAVVSYDDGYRVADHSTNGLFVNGSRVAEHTLEDGDEMQFGADSDHPVRFSASESRLDLTMVDSDYDFSREAFRDLKNLRRLIQVNKAITTSLEPEEAFELVLEGILEISSGQRAMILLRRDDDSLDTVYEKSLEGGSIRNKGISRTVVQRVVESGEPVLVNDLTADPTLQAQASIQALDLRSVVAIPLSYSRNYLARTRRGDSLMGVIYVDARSARRRFSKDDLDLMLAFSVQGAISMENAQMHRDLQENYLALVMSLAEAVEVKDRYTRGHSELVARYAVAIAGHLGLTAKEIEEVERGGMLHDVGKIGIDEAILNKEESLTDDEFEIMKMHPVYGAQILEPIPHLVNVRDMVLQHHEKIDGSGYPNGLQGDQISLGARIVAVCDVFEGITSNRPYRKPMTPKQVIAQLEEEAGPKLDVDCVGAFLRIYEASGYKKGAVGKAKRTAKRS